MNPLLYLFLLISGTFVGAALLRKSMFRKRLPDRNTLSFGIAFLAVTLLLYFTIGFIPIPGWDETANAEPSADPGLPKVLILYFTVISTVSLFLLIVGVMRGLTRKVSSSYQLVALFIAILIVMTLYYFFNLMGKM
jgi:hypothetical protein